MLKYINQLKKADKMALTLNAEQKSIYDIFSGENQYIIPPYQRAYSWTNVQCKALLEDIKKAFYDSEQEGYFLGNIVLAKSREERNKLEVIDGQQRLTTLTLLIKVLLSFDKENKALYNAIWIKDRRTDTEIQRLETNIFMEQDYNYFKEILAFDFSDNICKPKKEELSLFEQNICYFYNELKKFSKNNDIFKFADFLLDRIYILPIEIEDTDADKARKNALQIFETINNRGLNLSISDILKARLYSMALNELKHEDFIDKWKNLENKCEQLNSDIDSVFKIYRNIISHEQNKKYEEITLDKFFLQKAYSPFKFNDYEKIMDDLFNICNFTTFFIKIVQNPNINEELSKWFQIIHQGVQRALFFDDVYKFFYKQNLNDYSNLIEVSKKLIFTKKIIKEESKDEKFALSSLDNMYHVDFLLLIGLAYDTNIKAIHPYYFIENTFISYTVNNCKIERRMLVNLNSDLEDDKKCLELINKVCKIIKKYNEN